MRGLAVKCFLSFYILSPPVNHSSAALRPSSPLLACRTTHVFFSAMSSCQQPSHIYFSRCLELGSRGEEEVMHGWYMTAVFTRSILTYVLGVRVIGKRMKRQKEEKEREGKSERERERGSTQANTSTTKLGHERENHQKEKPKHTFLRFLLPLPLRPTTLAAGAGQPPRRKRVLGQVLSGE